MTTTLYHRRASVAFIDDAARFCKVGHSFADADIEPREGGQQTAVKAIVVLTSK